MSKSTYYPPNILKEFIALYRNLPCLWQISSRGYKDKQLKKRAYEILVEKLREVNVNADREEVSRRINILRTSFRREYKKALKLAIKYPKSRFKSSLWYYDLMKFVEEDKGEPMEDNISKTEPNEVFIESMDYNEDMFENVTKNDPLTPTSSPELLPFQTVCVQSTAVDTNNPRDYGRRDSYSEMTKRKSSRVYDISQSSPPMNAEQHVYETTSRESGSAHEYDYQVFGNYVVAKLKRSATRQSMIAEKIIADVLLRANLGTLTENSCLSENVDHHGYLITSDK